MVKINDLLKSPRAPTREELRARYAEWTTEELVRTAERIGLTEEARSELEKELTKRGVAIDTVSASPEKTTDDQTVAGFRVGIILGQSFSILFKNFLPFILLALIVYSPLILAVAILGPSEATEGTQSVWAGIAGLAHLPLWLLLTATLSYGTFQELRGQRASAGECVFNGLKRIFAVLGVMLAFVAIIFLVVAISGLIFGIAGTQSKLLFAITGVVTAVVFFVLVTTLWVVVPVAVVENPGIGKSLSRSAQLTKGYRWSIFAIIFLLGVVAVLAELVLKIPGAIIAATAGLEAAKLSAVLSEVASAFAAALNAVVAAVSYYRLRAVKEGVDIQEIAAVFD